MKEMEKDLENRPIDDPDKDVFDTEEITIEEMSIDGICGVY